MPSNYETEVFFYESQVLDVLIFNFQKMDRVWDGVEHQQVGNLPYSLDQVTVKSCNLTV